MTSALTQLHESIAAGDHYSAHQKARTTATRLLAPARRGPAPTPDSNGYLPFDAKAKEAATLLYEGAVALLEKGQTGSGVDLGGYLCDVWKARGVECGAEERGEFTVQQWGLCGVFIRKDSRLQAQSQALERASRGRGLGSALDFALPFAKGGARTFLSAPQSPSQHRICTLPSSDAP